ADAAGENAIAFNGPPTPRMPVNFQNLTVLPIDAVGNMWEHCGPLNACDRGAVQAFDVLTASLAGTVGITPALPTRPRARPHINAIEPPLAAAGTLGRIYGTRLARIDAIGTSCPTILAANTCRPLRGNCVFIDRTPADVIAVTPTMLVVRAPFTCVAPVSVHVRTRWGHGVATAPFCLVPSSEAAD